MVNEIDVGRCGVPGALVLSFGISALAGALYKGGTTDGAAYSYASPDDKTFAVWGVIYSLQLVWTIAQAFEIGVRGVREARGWLALNYLSASVWLLANGAANAGFSYWLAVVVLFITLFSLVQAYRALDVDYTRGCLTTRLCFWLPVSCNLAWVFVAAILNATNTALASADGANKVAVGGPDFAIGVIGLATAVAAYLAATRVDLGYAAVTVWALLGIHRNQTSPHSKLEPSKELDTMAIGCCVAIGVAAALGVALHVCGASSRPRLASASPSTAPLLGK